MLTVPTATRQSRRNLPPGRVGKVLLMDRSGTIDARLDPDNCSADFANRAVRLDLQLPIGLDLPIAA